KRNGRLPSAAINLVTAHDGFTLRDCVCFNHKHNEANGEENRDGTNNNYSNNHGKEGLVAEWPVQALEYKSFLRFRVGKILDDLCANQLQPLLLKTLLNRAEGALLINAVGVDDVKQADEMVKLATAENHRMLLRWEAKLAALCTVCRYWSVLKRISDKTSPDLWCWHVKPLTCLTRFQRKRRC
uniref:carbon starvation induced protein CsiD n=1 Tax=Escherichia coli TaxID=562 RepID=UPI003CD05EF1